MTLEELIKLLEDNLGLDVYDSIAPTSFYVGNITEEQMGKLLTAINKHFEKTRLIYRVPEGLKAFL